MIWVLGFLVGVFMTCSDKEQIYEGASLGWVFMVVFLRAVGQNMEGAR